MLITSNADAVGDCRLAARLTARSVLAVHSRMWMAAVVMVLPGSLGTAEDNRKRFLPNGGSGFQLSDIPSAEGDSCMPWLI